MHRSVASCGTCMRDQTPLWRSHGGDASEAQRDTFHWVQEMDLDWHWLQYISLYLHDAAASSLLPHAQPTSASGCRCSERAAAERHHVRLNPVSMKLGNAAHVGLQPDARVSSYA
jgi:hypothetical protein